MWVFSVGLPNLEADWCRDLTFCSAVLLCFVSNHQVDKHKGSYHMAYVDKQESRLCLVRDSRDQCGPHRQILADTHLRPTCTVTEMFAARALFSVKTKAALIFSVELCSVIRPAGSHRSHRGDQQQVWSLRNVPPDHLVRRGSALSSQPSRL
jgi:hypothetical protein